MYSRNWEVNVISSDTNTKSCTVCFRPVWVFDETKCVFHTEISKRDENDLTFRRHFNEQVKSKQDYSFHSYIFPRDFKLRLDSVDYRADFSNARFTGITSIVATRFNNKVLFKDNRVDGILLFEDVAFEHSLEFSDFIVYPEKRSNTTIIFRGVNFPSNATFFRSIHSISFESISDESIATTVPGTSISDAPVFVFRQCCLKDVYFDSSDMGLFPFFKSSFFENAHIIACNWPDVTERLFQRIPFTTHTRKYVIPEEWLVRQLKSSSLKVEDKLALCKRYELWGNFSYSDVGSIYRRIKTSLDTSKAYEEAAWLYFNEIEMRRVAWAEEFYSEQWYNRFKKLPPFLWGLIYSFYKICAGYGERPLNSAISFVLFLFLFASLHVLNGLQFEKQIINYDLSFTGFGIFFSPQFWSDWGEGLKYAILRLVPLGYVPIKPDQAFVGGTGVGDILLSLANTTILTLLLIFIGLA